MNEQRLAIATAATAVDTIAPDGSEIRFLPQLGGGSMVHCRVPVGITTRAVRHRTVEELWYILSGTGEIWRGRDSWNQVDPLVAGTAVTIPLGVHFQFRNTGQVPLDIVIVTMPPWPCMEEAERVEDYWPPATYVQT